MTDNENATAESSKPHSCRGTFLTNAQRKLRPIFTIALRDTTQIHGSGLPILLTLSVLLSSLIGVPFFIIANADAGLGGVVHYDGAWTAKGVEGIIVGSDPNRAFLGSITVLHMVFAYSIVVTMILVSVAFSVSYDQEMKKGTVRTLTCYPVGVFEITIAKLANAAVAGFIFGFPTFLLPTLIGLRRPVGDLFAIFLVAYLMSLLIVTVGAFTANSMAFATRKMYVRPTLLANLSIIFSLFTTSTILSLLNLFLNYGSPFFHAIGELTPISLYHQGRLLLMLVFGGSESPNWLIFLLPTALLVLGVWLTLKLWPGIYERE